MNTETYSIALQLIEVMDTNPELRQTTSPFGEWYDHLVNHMVDYESKNFDQVLVLKTLKNQLEK